MPCVVPGKSCMYVCMYVVDLRRANAVLVLYPENPVCMYVCMYVVDLRRANAVLVLYPENPVCMYVCML